MVPNLYSFLSQVLEDARFLMLDLKFSFLCISLHTDSQFLCAFENSHHQTSQLSLTLLPQVFRDSSYLCGQVLSHDLKCFEFPEITVLQYAKDILLFPPSEEFSSQGTQALLNYLADRGYKPKA